jgi:hypothetical protein
MAISEKTRKTLWGRSGNRCAICRHTLVVDATLRDDDSVVGEECHIVSPKERGPRFDPTFPQSQVDDAGNLILLCRVHHKQVDDQTQTYSVDTLRAKKAEHEAWVSSALSKQAPLPPVRVRRVKENEPSHFLRLRSGREVFAIVDRASAYQFDHDDLKSPEEVGLVAAFLQDVQEYGEMSEDLEAGRRVEAAFELGEQLEQLEEAGFWVFGSREIRRLEGGVGQPAPFPIALVRVVRDCNPEIITLDFTESAGQESQ